MARYNRLGAKSMWICWVEPSLASSTPHARTQKGWVWIVFRTYVAVQIWANWLVNRVAIELHSALALRAWKQYRLLGYVLDTRRRMDMCMFLQERSQSEQLVTRELNHDHTLNQPPATSWPSTFFWGLTRVRKAGVNSRVALQCRSNDIWRMSKLLCNK